MARIIGLDYGHRRVGLAVTDPMQLIATPLKTLSREAVIPFLQKYIATESVEAVVVGLPLPMYQGAHASRAEQAVRQYTRVLQASFPQLPFYHWDERFTSVMAQAALLEAGVRKSKRQDKSLLDGISAVFILRSFLERHQQVRQAPLPADEPSL